MSRRENEKAAQRSVQPEFDKNCFAKGRLCRQKKENEISDAEFYNLASLIIGKLQNLSYFFMQIHD